MQCQSVIVHSFMMQIGQEDFGSYVEDLGCRVEVEDNRITWQVKGTSVRVHSLGRQPIL